MIAAWRAVWSGRHTVAVAVLTPVLWVAFRSAAGPDVAASFAWTWLLALTALVGAAALATYLPSRRDDDTMAAPCAKLAGVHVALAALMLSLGPAVPMRGILAFGMVTFALVQRLTSSSTCAL